MPISRKYRPILAVVDDKPRTTTDLFRRYTGLGENVRLSNAQRRQRRWFYNALMNMVADGVVEWKDDDEQRFCRASRRKGKLNNYPLT